MFKSNLSEAQLAANRENAKKSTGPKTPEGKAASSQNAVKHALFRTVLVLPDESQDEFDELLKDTMNSYEPQNLAERLLIEQIVEANWKIRRLQRAEREMYLKADENRLRCLTRRERLEQPVDAADLMGRLLSNERYHTLTRAQDRFYGIIARAQREFDRLRKMRRQAEKDAVKGLHEKGQIDLVDLRNEAKPEASAEPASTCEEATEPESQFEAADMPAEAGTPGEETRPMTVPEPDLRL